MNCFKPRGKVRHLHFSPGRAFLRYQSGDDAAPHRDLNFVSFIDPGQETSETMSQVPNTSGFHL
jgi:hypothetical protein